MGTESVDLLIQRAQVLRSRDVEQSMSLLEDALALAQKENYKLGIAIIIRDKAVCHLQQQHFKRALSGFNEALQFFRALQEKTGQIGCNNEISAIYFKLGDCPAAMEHILDNLKIHTSLGDSQGIAACYIDIGNLYMYLQEHSNAIEHYKKALKIFEGLKNKKEIVNCYFLLGNAFNTSDEEDRSLYYLLRAAHALEEVHDIDIRTKTLGSLANLYTRQEDYEKALAYFHQAITTADDGASIPVRVQLKKNLGNLYIELTQFDKAIEVLLDALQQARMLPPETQVVRIYQLLAIAYERMGDFSLALKHHKKFHDLDKQVTSDEVNLKTKALHFKYDLEELKKQKEIAELSDKLKEQFLANVSHEIRTPMNGVLGMTHLLNKSNPTKEQQEYIDAIQDSANNLMVIINDILDFSKINAGKIEFASSEFQLRDLIKGVLQILKVKADEKKLQLTVAVDYAIKDTLIGDAMRLNQVLMNLVGNAIKFTDQGKVAIDVRMITSDDAGYRLRFRVTDTGIGIPENKLQKIFESFEQAGDNKRRSEGTGLGLTIVKQLVELQGGNIHVKSRFGEGADFIFELPFGIGKQKKEEAAVKLIEPEEKTDVSHIRLLVVEDNRINQLLVKNMLKKFGFSQIEMADNGKMALQVLESQPFDIVLMDIQMPDMDGYEATRFLRKKLAGPNAKIPVIALTADASEKERTHAQDAGMNDYVVKPYTPEELFGTLLKFVKDIPAPADNDLAEILQEKRRKSGVNLKVLEQYTGGETELTIQLISIFLRQIPDAIQKLGLHIPDKNWKEVHAVAHKIKSSISVFELSELRKLVTNIEEYARDGMQLEEVPALYARFKSGALEAIAELEAELDRIRRVSAG
jgi:signal transduction histidine kinase/CheY-like chemotaxis protein/HPt (histidine-containing phosphotransfer) domain-containing protein